MQQALQNMGEFKVWFLTGIAAIFSYVLPLMSMENTVNWWQNDEYQDIAKWVMFASSIGYSAYSVYLKWKRNKNK